MHPEIERLRESNGSSPLLLVTSPHLEDATTPISAHSPPFCKECGRAHHTRSWVASLTTKAPLWMKRHPERLKQTATAWPRFGLTTVNNKSENPTFLSDLCFADVHRAMNSKSMDDPSDHPALPNKCSCPNLSEPLLSIIIITRDKNCFLLRSHVPTSSFYTKHHRTCTPNDSVGRQQYPHSQVSHVRKHKSLVIRFTILHHRSCYRRQHSFIGL